jgi:DNA-binding beta-propeller fold protein YncE
MIQKVKNNFSRKEIFFPFLIILLLFLTIPSDFILSQERKEEDRILSLIKEANSLYESGEYSLAIEKFKEIIEEIRKLNKEKIYEEKIAEAYLTIGICYIGKGEKENAIRSFFEVLKRKPDLELDPVWYSPKVISVFNEAKEEYRKMIEEEKKKEEERKAEEIKKMEEEKKRAEEKREVTKPEIKERIEKPKKRFPILYIVAGLAVAGGVAYMLLAKSKKEEGGEGNISITSEPEGAKVYLDGQDTGKRTNTTLTNIKVGTHQLKLELELYGKWEGNVEVKKNYTTIVQAKLAPFKYEFVTKWGSYGSGDYQFYYPFGVAVDSSGNVYVADTGNKRIMKFNSNGSFLTKWGSVGSGDYQFNHPEGVAVDSSGNVYVADTDNHRIMKFTSNGSFITKWGSYGSGDYQFYYPSGVAVDGSGNVYVADGMNHRIMKFTSNGSFITKWGSKGSGDYQFDGPSGVAVDSSGNVYVADSLNHRIMKFTSNGSFITKWGSLGSGDYQFEYPYKVAVDSSGNVYVADSLNHRIMKFTSNGSFITKWGSFGSGDYQFYFPCGVAVDSSGNVYVADTYNHRIMKFRISSQTTFQVNISYSPINESFNLFYLPSSKEVKEKPTQREKTKENQ